MWSLHGFMTLPDLKKNDKIVLFLLPHIRKKKKKEVNLSLCLTNKTL
jgi:hypothetical protein